MSARVFTMRRCCKFCRTWFTINGSNHWFCGYDDCTRRRRKADRAERKAQEAAGAVARMPSGSAGHLARALKSGD